MGEELNRQLGIRTGPQIERDGGHVGAKIVKKGRTGEQALKEWEEENGSINIPAYLRRGKKKRTGHEKFSDS